MKEIFKRNFLFIFVLLYFLSCLSYSQDIYENYELWNKRVYLDSGAINETLECISQEYGIDTDNLAPEGLFLFLTEDVDKKEKADYYIELLDDLYIKNQSNEGIAILSQVLKAAVFINGLAELSKGIQVLNSTLECCTDIKMRINLLNLLGYLTDFPDPKRAVQYYKQALELVEKDGNINEIAYAKWRFGLALARINEKKESLHYLNDFFITMNLTGNLSKKKKPDLNILYKKNEIGAKQIKGFKEYINKQSDFKLEREYAVYNFLKERFDYKIMLDDVEKKN